MNTYPTKNNSFVRNLSLAIGCGFACIAGVGCTPTKPLYLNDTGDLSYYIDKATAVEYPDVDIPSLEEVTQSQQPLTVIDSDFANFEDLTLEDVVSMALQNTKILRGYGTPSLTATRVSPGVDNLTNGIEAASSIYNIAIRESEPGFISTPGTISSPSNILTNTALDSNQGVEAALADFDAAYTSSVSLTTSDEPRNGSSIIISADVFTQTQVSWQNEFSKKSANGTQLFFRSINQYTENNNPLITDGGIQALDSFYRASLEAEIRQPLLRGRGAFIQRMPIVISRINTDQEIANLEATLHNMVTNLEIRYWDLYLAYRSFESAKIGRDAALETWRIIEDQYKEGAEVNIQNVAQASEQYHFFDAQVIDAYNNLLNAEGQLRFLLGWSTTDGRFIRPIDEPVKAPVEFNWCESLCEALTYRPEVRRRRWEIKKRELAVQYSKNGLLPQLDVSLVYRWLGLGNRFGTDGDSNAFPDINSGALNELYGGDHQELALNGTFALPIGFRREEANVRNAQLKLAREIARGEDLELDITKELSETMRALAANQMIMRSAFNRWISTDEEVKHFERLEDAGVESLDVALDSQRRRSQAEIAFYTAVVEYNKVIALLHHRKGTILAYSGVEYQEGPWSGKAYIDAQEHARRRGASRELNYGWTRPQVISRGANQASTGNTGYIAPAPSLPAGYETPGYSSAPISDPNGIVPLNSLPYNGQEVQPFYQEPVDSNPINGFPIQSVPEPVVPLLNSLSKNNSGQKTGSAVRQVSYHQPVASSAKEKFEPVAARIVSRGDRVARPVKPQRDNINSAGVKRLRATAQTDNHVRLRKTSATTVQQSNIRREVNSTSTRTNKAVSQNSNIDWERLGFSRPEQSNERTRARIKAN